LNIAANTNPTVSFSTGKLILGTLGILALWLLVTKLFWVGYAGSDDLFYSRYAFLFHRIPINWWESRTPAILAIRTAFRLFGPSEFAAALPTLLASLASLAAIAWYAGWPNHLTWKTAATALLAATFPLNVTYQTVPGAIFVASGLLIVGSVCILRGLPWIGAACFALAIETHELSCFYAAIFLGTAVVLNRTRFWKPLLMSVLLTIVAVGAECVANTVRYGQPLLRFHLVLGESAGHAGAFDPDTHLTGVQFFLWPLQNLIFSKAFGPDILLLLVVGVAVWRALSEDERILLVSGLVTWAYLGYGSKVPWDYRPMARMFHFYGPLCLSVSVLLPVCLGYLFRRRSRPPAYAMGTIAAIVLVHVFCCAAGGRWGQPVATSKVLLRYAANHPGSTFVTDVATLNHMYVLSGFQLPANVICVNGSAVQQDFLINKQPPGTPKFVFPDRPADGMLLNLDQLDIGSDPDFPVYVAQHPGSHETISPKRYKTLFAILPARIRNMNVAVKNLGAEVVLLR
jgi:hypothetical protein